MRHRSLIASLSRLISISFSRDWVATVFGFIVSLGLGLIPPIQVWLLGRLVSSLAQSPHSDGRELLSLAVGLGVTAGVSASANSIRNMLGRRIEFAVRAASQGILSRRLADWDPEWIEDSSKRDDLQSARITAQERIGPLLPDIYVWTGQLLSVVGVVALLARISPLIAIVLLATSLVPALFVPRVYRIWRDAQGRVAASERFVDAIGIRLIDPVTYQNMRVNGSLGRLVAIQERHLEDVRRVRVGATDGEGRIGLLTSALIAVLLTVALMLLVARHADPGAAAMVVASIQALSLLLNIVFAGGDIATQLGFMRDFATEAEVISARPLHALDQRPEAILINNATYTYPSGWVLGPINCQVPASGVTAIVGANGSGKTTLLKLLEGSYSCQAGDIAPEPRRAAEQGRISSVAQSLEPLPVTVSEYLETGRENGVGGSLAPEAREALEQVGMARVAAEPGAVLAKGYEGSIGLSGGEWQRVELARVVASRRPLWLLDEPTSMLDPRMEERVVSELLREAGGVTIVLVTHRMWAARRADHIIVMAGGQVVEEGNPAELLKRDGEFARLVRAQE